MTTQAPSGSGLGSQPAIVRDDPAQVDAPQGPVRYHAFDGLGATMMLLGLVIHTATTYSTLPLGDAWPFKDPKTSPLFDFH